jgi:hypothetical protein
MDDILIHFENSENLQDFVDPVYNIRFTSSEWDDFMNSLDEFDDIEIPDIDIPTPNSNKRRIDSESSYEQTPETKRTRHSWVTVTSVSEPMGPPPSKRRGQSARKAKCCSVVGCTKGSRSRGLCKRHGGGKRCTYLACTRSDQGGGFCIAHGGGKKCAVESCKNSAQSRGLCKSHGGKKYNA